MSRIAGPVKPRAATCAPDKVYLPAPLARADHMIKDTAVAMVPRHAVPAINFSGDWAAAGGFMGYGPTAIERGRQAGILTGRVLTGKKRPNSLNSRPGEQLELFSSEKAGRRLGISIEIDRRFYGNGCESAAAQLSEQL